MPENCDCCLFDDGVHCFAYPPSAGMVYDIVNGKPDFCPLIELQPHGRLIDADAFDERVRLAGGMADEELSDDFKDGIQTTLLLLKSQRTVIEADYPPSVPLKQVWTEVFGEDGE